ncbi:MULTISPECIES: hypothetical protein [Sphingobium]|uniref:Uncharacterized protein n=1 Tax=Sphingobium chungbukense TaxID=56193 RepID=A0A0M3AQV4_9SPHN|nr:MULTISPECIES: hypothetical protein [Sphingobium]KKW91296.1 hypothetical protein YP76_17190 [Sphingobium chungbukense]PJG47603.1 hypothetical protein CAF53_04620 [Sphingobium sp. LB126]
MSRLICFLPYTPRSDSEERGYEQWLQDVDNPFFNSRPPVHHYTNWRVAGGPTEAFPYTHFDFLLIEPGKTADDVWTDGPLAEFAANWVKLWGVAPEGDPALNYQCYVAEYVSGDAGAYAPLIEISLDLSSVGEQWRITQNVVGQAQSPGFTRRFISRSDPASNAIIGELVAGPR